MGFDFIMIAPSYYLSVASLNVAYLFLLLLGSGILLSMVVQQLVAILVLLQEEMSVCPSTPLSGNGSSCVLIFYASALLNSIIFSNILFFGGCSIFRVFYI